MKTLKNIFECNKKWARSVNEEDPTFFKSLSNQQNPEYFWIGCSDSRVPANEIMGLKPGEVFVHRNIANVVVHSDMNFLSVLQYAVDVLKVKHIIVCGHYDCGGIKGAMESKSHGLVDNWLRHIRDVYAKYEMTLKTIKDETKRIDKMCELNVIEQVANVCHTTIVQDAWARGQKLAVHGWIYTLTTGILDDMQICVQSADELSSVYKLAIDHELEG